MNDPKDKMPSPALEKVYQSLRQLPYEASPHLETRVLALMRERKAPRQALTWWKSLAIGASAFSVLAVAVMGYWMFRGTTYEAFVDQPFVVRIELKTLDQSQIAKARIELPEGVFFDIDEFPELREQRVLSLRWTKRDTGVFPFVLSASEAGLKTITVRFLNDRDDVVAERVFSIRLKGGALKKGAEEHV